MIGAPVIWLVSACGDAEKASLQSRAKKRHRRSACLCFPVIDRATGNAFVARMVFQSAITDKKEALSLRFSLDGYQAQEIFSGNLSSLMPVNYSAARM